MKWFFVNILLVIIYLLFFHTCLWSSSDYYPFIGLAYSAIWTGVCFAVKPIFKNSYEFFFYQLVAVDILLEGFIPLHEGYSFYYCALAFWLVFSIYRFTGNSRFKCLCSGNSMEDERPQNEPDK